MVSILIPLYNYDVVPLVQRLSEEASKLNTPIEIRVQDDASTEEFPNNKSISKFANVHYERSISNRGRPQTHQILAEKAQYNNLLFLDADVFPVHDDFLKRYLDYGLQEFDVIAGGISYQQKAPAKDMLLRWTYGHKRESRSVQKRNESPYIITPANLFIRKEVFLQANRFKGTTYGMDLALSFQLKKLAVAILHIENTVDHLGLETDTQFLKKSIAAIENLVALEKEGGIDEDFTSLQKAFINLKKMRLVPILGIIGSKLENYLVKNLTSGNPNLRLMDLYRLQHYIKLKS